MLDQIVGQKKRPGFIIHQRLEIAFAGVELIAVGAGDALDLLLRQDRVEHAAGAAVGVGHQDIVVLAARRVDLLAHGFGYLLVQVMEMRRQARH